MTGVPGAEMSPEVLVVGGGPAGSTVATLLARRGRDVLLLDRATFPRTKPCGECVDPGAVEALARIGTLDDVLALGPVRLEGWRVHTDAADVSACFGDGIHGLGVERIRLDAALLECARREGARVRTGMRVIAVSAAVDLQPGSGPGSRGRPSVRVRHIHGDIVVLRPRIVVGADGLRSVVVRGLNLIARRPRLRKVSITAHVEGTGLPDHGGALDVMDGVTLGVAPVGAGRWNVTVVTSGEGRVAEVAAGASDFLERILRERYPDAHASRVDEPVASGPFDWPVRRAWAPGVALVGDAAGYFDPVTGQGIYRALRSAEFAAEAVDAALTEESWAPLARYDQIWKREVAWSRRVQRGVEMVMARPTLRGRMLRRLGASGGLPVVIRVTGDVAAPARLLDPRVWVGWRPV